MDVECRERDRDEGSSMGGEEEMERERNRWTIFKKSRLRRK